MEANHNLFGLGEDLSTLPNTKIVFLTRNKESWTKSAMNVVRRSRFNMKAVKKLTPGLVGKEIEDWKKYDLNKKFGWVWEYLDLSFKTLAKKKNVRIYSFEELFELKEGGVLRDFLSFIRDYSNGDLEEYTKRFKELLKFKMNQSN